MSKRAFYFWITIGAAFITVGIWIFWWRLPETRMSPAPPPTTSGPLAPEVEEVIQRKIALVEELLRDPVIIAAVKKANVENKSLSPEEINRRDELWRRAADTNAFIQSFLTNAVADRLLEFQETHRGFAEIFIADAHGLNVGQTNKTSDYYQADEEWWQEGYHEGLGRAFHGPLEFDESAQAEAIPIYVPVFDSESHAAMGVAKAIVNVAAIRLEL